MRRLFPFKGSKPPSSFSLKTLSIIFTIQFFHSLFRNTNYFPKLNHGFPKITESIDASLSEPYSTVWRQPITFKRLQADWLSPHNRRGSWLRISLSAPNSFVVKSNLSGAWVTSAERSSISRFFNMAYKMASSV